MIQMRHSIITFRLGLNAVLLASMALVWLMSVPAFAAGDGAAGKSLTPRPAQSMPDDSTAQPCAAGLTRLQAVPVAV